MKTFNEALTHYQPQESRCPFAVWQKVAPAAIKAVIAAEITGTPKLARSYIGALSGVLGWIHSEGYDASDFSVALGGDSIEAYTATLKSNQATVRSRLRRLSEANGYDPRPTNSATYGRRQYQPPYSPDELEALREYAKSLGNDQIRLNIEAVMALSAGCGFPVRELSQVSAAEVHKHAGKLHVRSKDRCVPVRVECVASLLSVVVERPEGLLIGPQNRIGNIERLSEWVPRRNGLPELSVFRLRTTWICAHLKAGTGALELLAISGQSSLDGFDGYRQFVPAFNAECNKDTLEPDPVRA